MGWNFVERFCFLLENTEVPQRFALWCGLGTLLSSLGRNVWIDQGIYSIYPNLYLVLVAASGQKKSTAIGVASRLLRKAGVVNIVSQKATPEALISSIKEAKIVVDDGGVAISEVARGGVLVADELATFLDKSSLERGMGPLLTKLYDCTPFEYVTMKRGEEKIEEGFFSIIGGTTVELLRNTFPKDAIGGGLTSRMIFVYEDEIPPPVPWVNYTDQHRAVEQELVDYLKQLHRLRGRVELSKEARECFEVKYRERYARGGFRSNPLLQSYENRRHMHLLKIAMGFMLAGGPRLEMTRDDIERASIALGDAEIKLPQVLSLIVASEIGALASSVLNFIMTKREVTRVELVRKFSTQVDSRELGRVLDTLVAANQVVLATKPQVGLVYRLAASDEGAIGLR